MKIASYYPINNTVITRLSMGLSNTVGLEWSMSDVGIFGESNMSACTLTSNPRMFTSCGLLSGWVAADLKSCWTDCYVNLLRILETYGKWTLIIIQVSSLFVWKFNMDSCEYRARAYDVRSTMVVSSGPLSESPFLRAWPWSASCGSNCF